MKFRTYKTRITLLLKTRCPLRKHRVLMLRSNIKGHPTDLPIIRRINKTNKLTGFQLAYFQLSSSLDLNNQSLKIPWKVTTKWQKQKFQNLKIDYLWPHCSKWKISLGILLMLKRVHQQGLIHIEKIQVRYQIVHQTCRTNLKPKALSWKTMDWIHVNDKVRRWLPEKPLTIKEREETKQISLLSQKDDRNVNIATDFLMRNLWSSTWRYVRRSFLREESSLAHWSKELSTKSMPRWLNWPNQSFLFTMRIKS